MNSRSHVGNGAAIHFDLLNKNARWLSALPGAVPPLDPPPSLVGCPGQDAHESHRGGRTQRQGGLQRRRIRSVRFDERRASGARRKRRIETWLLISLIMSAARSSFVKPYRANT